jgi:exopolysaccharide production protein ExoQ
LTPSLALIAFLVGIAGLFYLDRDASVQTSKALWLPVIWMWIYGARPVSAWFGRNPLEDSPIDQAIAAILIVSGILVLSRRKGVFLVLRNSWPILLYISFCLLSITWADFPGQGLKRWIKAAGELVMVLVVATDPKPVAALKRFFSRVGFLLLPVSVLLLKYYPVYGHGYDIWGNVTNTGVTTDKNMLGVLTFVVTLGTFWQVLGLLRDKQQPNRSRHLLAQGTLLFFGMNLLFTAHSATSGASFTLGAVLLFLLGRPKFIQQPRAVHALVFTILLGGCLTVLLGGRGAATHALGRGEDFTGRTDVWKLLIPMAPNPVVGAGFENFWYGPRLENLWRIYGGVNEAHDGYLEVYLNLGLVGVSLIVLILLNGYFAAVAIFRRDPMLGNLIVAFVLSAAIYSITEAGFRMLDPIWFALLLTVITAGRSISTGASTVATEPNLQRTRGPLRAPQNDNLQPKQPSTGKREARLRTAAPLDSELKK